MDELLRHVMAQTGLSEEQSQQAIAAVLSFLNEKVPAPLMSQIEATMNNPEVLKQAEGIVKQGLKLFN